MLGSCILAVIAPAAAGFGIAFEFRDEIVVTTFFLVGAIGSTCDRFKSWFIVPFGRRFVRCVVVLVVVVVVVVVVLAVAGGTVVVVVDGAAVEDQLC